MIWRIALAAWLTLLLAVLGQQSHAQFNGCSAGFCSRVAGGGASGCSQATAFLARTSGLNGTHTAAYTTLVCGCYADAVCQKLDEFQIQITADATTAKLNLIQNAYNSTAPNGEPTFAADAGYTGVGTTYLDSQFNASTATTPNYTQNSASMFVCLNTSAADTGDEMGLASGAQNQFKARNGADILTATINASAPIAISNTDGSGLWVANRTSSANVDIYRNGASFSASNVSASAAVQNSDMTFLVGSNFSNYNIFAGGWGSTLTAGNITALSARIKAFVLAVSGLSQCG